MQAIYESHFLRLLGERGALEIRGEGTLELSTAAGTRSVPLETPAYGPFADFARGVLDSAHECAISAAEALRVSEIALKTREAADSGRRVRL